MSPPNDDRGVSSATEVMGAGVNSVVVDVLGPTVIVPRSAFVVGVVVAVNVAAF
jgi:hypothetical protein